MKYLTSHTLFLTVLFLSGSASLAQTPLNDIEQIQRLGISYSIAAFGQGSSDLDGGGSYSLSSIHLRAGIMKPVSASSFMGFGINYDTASYTFMDVSAFGGQQPWGKIHALNFNLPFISLTNTQWTFMVSPSLGMSREVDADLNDSLVYGATMIASYNFERGNRIGIGLGGFDRLDETIFYPFLSIKWQLTENLRIGNALNAGPTGPSGLQLAYRFVDKWEIAIGFARRSHRFRLDDSGISPGGIGTQKGRLAFLRLSTDLTPSIHLDLHAGVIHDGVLLLENNENVPVASADYEAAPLLALNFNGRF